ncbi:MAG: DNA polymerase III subunit alpha [Anaerolineae bacterium]|nr:DNA polymerase III subunit alpha [Anaerolineae bacterium]
MYAELHCHSNFSLLDGASHPEVLAARAAELGMPALALTDHNAVYGAVRFFRAARTYGVKPILGAEMTLDDGKHLTLLVENERGWHNLCTLISEAQQHVPKGEAILPLEALAGRTHGLIALSGCRKGAVTSALLERDRQTALDAATYYRNLFGENNFWIELQNHLLPEDDVVNAQLVGLARQLNLGFVATNNVHYAEPDGSRLQDVLVCINHHTTLNDSHHLRRPNSEYYLKSQAQMAPLFGRYPEALENSLFIASRCNFELAYGLQDLPRYPTPHQMTASEYLRYLCEVSLLAHYASIPAKVFERLTHELSVIENAGLSNYFLIVWDIVRFARENEIRCQGRGSAANSLVAYLLDITPIDPLAHDLVFERFLSEEHQLTPDIDIDFDASRREEVIQYVYDSYGSGNAAMACTFVTYRARSALRDVGKALGLPAEQINQAAEALDTYDPQELADSPSLRETLGGAIDALPWRQLFELVGQIGGFPRHLGIHNGGMVVTGPPMASFVPIEPATMPGRVVTQWDKTSLEDAGLVKIDCLGLRMLSTIDEALDLVEQASGDRPDLDGLTFDDPAIYEMITNANTVGVFQIESRAQTQMLPRLKPTCFEDLIAAVSLIHLRPIQEDMVHSYLRRRQGEEEVTYQHPLMEPILKETLGVFLFEEQVAKIARDVAGFSAGQEEILRRGLGNRPDERMTQLLRQAFIDGARKKDVPEDVAGEIFESLRAAAGCVMPKSHAASFAVIVYQSAWLKHYHTAAFYAALLNNQPMGFWRPAVLLNVARRLGIEILPVDINLSQERSTISPDQTQIRLGLSTIKGFGQATIERVLYVRAERPYNAGLVDFCKRTQMPRRLVENLIMAGAMDGWRVPRRKLLWDLGTLQYKHDELGLEFANGDIELPRLTEQDSLVQEYAVMGFSAQPHSLTLYRSWLTEQGVISTEEVRDRNGGKPVKVAGLMVVHQAPPTAKGHRFLTLEDEFGLLDVIVRPNIYEQYRQIVRGSAMLIVEGTIQRKNRVISLIAQKISALLPMG